MGLPRTDKPLKSWEKDFVNEKARRIRITLEWWWPGTVTIRMEGPDSIAENIVTQMEAMKLREGLTEVQEWLDEAERHQAHHDLET